MNPPPWQYVEEEEYVEEDPMLSIEPSVTEHGTKELNPELLD